MAMTGVIGQLCRSVYDDITTTVSLSLCHYSEMSTAVIRLLDEMDNGTRSHTGCLQI